MADLTMYRGDTKVYDVAVTLNNAVVNLAGCSLWFTAKNRRSDTDANAVFQLTIGNGIEVTDEARGEVAITISPTDTEDLTFDRELYVDFQLEDAAGQVYTLYTGKLLVTADVTISRA